MQRRVLQACGPLSIHQTLLFQSRQVKTRDPKYEDDRWLEAEIANKEMTAEERYAFEKQHEILKKMQSQMPSKKDGTKKSSAAPAKDTEVLELKQQIKALEAKVAAIMAKKEK